MKLGGPGFIKFMRTTFKNKIKYVKMSRFNYSYNPLLPPSYRIPSPPKLYIPNPNN